MIGPAIKCGCVVVGRHISVVGKPVIVVAAIDDRVGATAVDVGSAEIRVLPSEEWTLDESAVTSDDNHSASLFQAAFDNSLTTRATIDCQRARMNRPDLPVGVEPGFCTAARL
jgi:hypothetical protein